MRGGGGAAAVSSQSRGLRGRVGEVGAPAGPGGLSAPPRASGPSTCSFIDERAGDAGRAVCCGGAGVAALLGFWGPAACARVDGPRGKVSSREPSALPQPGSQAAPSPTLLTRKQAGQQVIEGVSTGFKHSGTHSSALAFFLACRAMGIGSHIESPELAVSCRWRSQLALSSWFFSCLRVFFIVSLFCDPAPQ